MQTRIANHAGHVRQPVRNAPPKAAGGAVAESPQNEWIAQLEAMAADSPQARRQAQIGAMIASSPAMAAQRRMTGMAGGGLHAAQRPGGQGGTTAQLESTGTAGIRGAPKEQFLVSLRIEVFKTADQMLSRIGQTAGDCPYISKWFGYYADRDERHIEDAIARFAPASSEAADLPGYISAVVDRVRAGLENHIATGSTDDVPAELVEEEHKPEDFLHIANERGVAQLSSLCSGGDSEGNGNNGPPPVDYKGIYDRAQILNKTYANVRAFQHENGGYRIIKECPDHEITFFKTMSGVPHFPVCHGGGNGFVILDFIGDWPDPAPTADAGHVKANLDQAADICKAMAERNISHNDLDNNMLYYKGQLIVIDFGASREQEKGTALNANKSFIKRFLGSKEEALFDKLFE